MSRFFSFPYAPGEVCPHLTQFSSVAQLFLTLCDSLWVSCDWLFAAYQASLSTTNSRSLLKLTSIGSVMPSNYLILCCPLLLLPSIFPSIFGYFPMSQFFTSGDQSIGVSVSASILPMNIQDWFPLGWTGWISLKSKGLSRVFSNTTVQKHQFFSTLALHFNRNWGVMIMLAVSRSQPALYTALR